jgi:ferredoxin
MAEFVHELVLLRQILILVFDEVFEVWPLEVHVLGLLRELSRETISWLSIDWRKWPWEIAHGVRIGVRESLCLGFGRCFAGGSTRFRRGLGGFCVASCRGDAFVGISLSHRFPFWRHF